MRRVGVEAARQLVHGGSEIALLDVREDGQFGEGHALFAVPAPYSRLELMVPRLVPRPDAGILLIDDGDGVAERAARALERLAYSQVSVTTGGMPRWETAGFPVYKGVNVPSKTLGELAEAIWHPAVVAPETLREWQASGKDFRLFDARPPEEYAKMCVPGAVCLPNGELAHRLGAIGLGDGEPVVVTCAGRTRGIVGAIGLRLAGHDGPLFALDNGTQGWALAGFRLDRGNAAARFPELPQGELECVEARARGICRRFAIPMMAGKEAALLLADESRTTYLFDVRSREEAVSDPIAAAVRAPSGQLVQATDRWVGVRRARLVLADQGGLRAALAAFWLAQLGYDVHVALIDDALRTLRRPGGVAVGWKGCALPAIGATEALSDLRSGSACLLDLRPSRDFRREHVVGAAWSIRPRLARLADQLRGRRIHLIADSPEIARLAVADLEEAALGPMFLVDGGHSALAAAGAQTRSSPGEPPDEEAIDHLFFVHDRHEGNLDASRRYLAWETGLVAQLDQAERAEFSLFRPS